MSNEKQEVNLTLVPSSLQETTGKLSELTMGWEEISKVGSINLTQEQIDILYAPVDINDIQIRPDGLIYLPWIFYATRLRKAFGLGWSIIPNGLPKVNTEDYRKFVIWGFWLIIKGIVIGFAFGEQEYFGDSTGMSWTEACEGAKSNALMRLCKGMGISLELWDKEFITKWVKEFAYYELVWNDKKGKKVPVWHKRSNDTEDKKVPIKLMDEPTVMIGNSQPATQPAITPPIQGDYTPPQPTPPEAPVDGITTKQVHFIKGLCDRYKISREAFAEIINRLYEKTIDNLSKTEGSYMITELLELGGEGFVQKYSLPPLLEEYDDITEFLPPESKVEDIEPTDDR